MKRLTALVVMLFGVGGCQSPTNLSIPSVNVLAPYGTTRVPPPSTGSFGKPDTYYQPSTQSGLSANSSETAEPLATNADVNSPAERIRLTSAQADPQEANNAVRPAVGGSPANNTRPVRIIESKNATSSLASRLKGMHVNDATQPVEPRTLNAPQEIPDLSQLPQPPSDASAAPLAAGASRSRQPTPATNSAGSQSSTSTTMGWQIREDTGRTLRVAER